MTYPHRMHLHGPWRYKVCEGPDAGTSGKIQVPAGLAFLLPDSGNVALFERRFGRPNNLDDNERVWLVVEGVDPRGDVFLNGERLGEVAGYALPWSRDVTERLELRNTLCLEVPAPTAGAHVRPGRVPLPGGPVRPVNLEVRREMSLENPALWFEEANGVVRLRFQAKVVGRLNSPCRLEVRAANRVLAGHDIEALGHLNITTTLRGGECPPTWKPGDVNELAAIEVVLLDDHGAVWQTSRRTLFPQSAAGLDEASLLVGERRVVIAADPIGWLEPSDVEKLAAGQYPRPCEVRQLFGIHGDEIYGAADHLGVPLIQAVPETWVELVCPALAHHPSIVAWRITPMGGSAPQIAPGTTLLGRRVVP